MKNKLDRDIEFKEYKSKIPYIHNVFLDMNQEEYNGENCYQYIWFCKETFCKGFWEKFENKNIENFLKNHNCNICNKKEKCFEKMKYISINFKNIF